MQLVFLHLLSKLIEKKFEGKIHLSQIVGWIRGLTWLFINIAPYRSYILMLTNLSRNEIVLILISTYGFFNLFFLCSSSLEKISFFLLTMIYTFKPCLSLFPSFSYFISFPLSPSLSVSLSLYLSLNHSVCFTTRWAFLLSSKTSWTFIYLYSEISI